MTISTVRKTAAAVLKSANVENYDFESYLIVSEYTSKSRAQMAAYPEAEVSDHVVQKISRALSRRAAGEPLQYILGYWEFYSLRFMVREGVLIPRPETELLCELGIKTASRLEYPKILDLCCGSGCIAVSVAKNIGTADIYAADFYDIPLEVTRQNASFHAAAIKTVKADALSDPPDIIGDNFDIILSNPPYIPCAELPDLQREVHYEPAAALDGGDDGLVFYRSICKKYSRLLKPGGMLAFEIGIGQCEDVCQIMSENGLENIRYMKDLAGIDRVISGTLISSEV